MALKGNSGCPLCNGTGIYSVKKWVEGYPKTTPSGKPYLLEVGRYCPNCITYARADGGGYNDG